MFLEPCISCCHQQHLIFSLFVVASSYRQERSDNVVSAPYARSVKKLKCWDVEWVCQRKAEGQAKTTWATTGKRAASFGFSGQLKLRVISDSESLGHPM